MVPVVTQGNGTSKKQQELTEFFLKLNSIMKRLDPISSSFPKSNADASHNAGF